MTRIKVKVLIWDEVNRDHIKRHNVTIDQIEEVSKNQLAHKKGHSGRYIIIGRTGSRIISVIVKRKATGVYYPITARDAAKEERRRVYEKEKI